MMDGSITFARNLYTRTERPLSCHAPAAVYYHSPCNLGLCCVLATRLTVTASNTIRIPRVESLPPSADSASQRTPLRLAKR